MIPVARLLLLLAIAMPAQALRVDGMTFDDRLQLGGQALQLNGVGFRAEAWIKGYAAGLWLAHKAPTPPQVLATPGPKRLQLRMLLGVSTAEFVKAFHKGVQRNTPVADQPALAARMEQFERQVQSADNVSRGDVIDLDWLPGRGLLISINGRAGGEAIPGEDLYAALLRIFIGEHPVDAELKTGLLGGPATPESAET